MAGYVHGLLLFCVVRLCSAAEPVCNAGDQINSCSCQTDQGLVDLSPLDSGDPNNAKFSGIPDPAGNTFAYNPCSPFTDVMSYACINVAACQTRLYDSYNIGEQESAVFETDPTDGLRIKYRTYDGSGRQTYVALKCDESQEGTLTAIGEEPAFSSTYKLVLTSKYACPSGPTTHTVTTHTVTTSDVTTPCGFWLVMSTSLCIILGLSCLGLVFYIVCRKPVTSGGATVHCHCHEQDKQTEQTDFGYKRF